MSEQEILSAVQDIFRDNFDDDSLEINRSTCADDIEDWDSLEPDQPADRHREEVQHQVQAGGCPRPEGCRRSAGSRCTDGVIPQADADICPHITFA